jgi:glycosyltransferase involved in cell wall biosynthesis
LITDALEAHGAEVIRLEPTRIREGRVKRLVQMTAWDVNGAGRMARAEKCDVVVHAANTGRAGGIPSIVLMHDTMVLDHPLLFDRGYYLYARALFGTSAKAATVIVTPSNHSRSQILCRWPSLDVRVIPWPSKGQLETRSAQPVEDAVLMVSSLDKHKRIPLGIDVCAVLRKQIPNLKLTLVARSGNDTEEVSAALTRADPDGQWIAVERNIPESRLQQLYNRSSFLLVPSLDEGFCLPAIEAASRDVPVVHADRGALPEVFPWASQQVSKFSDTAADATVVSDRDLLLERALTLITSREEAERLREVGRASVQRFDARSFRTDWSELVSEVGH